MSESGQKAVSKHIPSHDSLTQGYLIEPLRFHGCDNCGLLVEFFPYRALMTRSREAELGFASKEGKEKAIFR
ncbi:unnamed protein product [Dovyalis caffra]|uniref:Uncharacterized protein n=1 Tax=Dovyalis caffra TaxID=77055 RepID=A0AAV1S8F6_9ROSI|nr:unnamed protein product [Dovyalis caffra]